MMHASPLPRLSSRGSGALSSALSGALSGSCCCCSSLSALSESAGALAPLLGSLALSGGDGCDGGCDGSGGDGRADGYAFLNLQHVGE
jgi:hypothetical protein